MVKRTGRKLSAIAASFFMTMSVLLYAWAPGVFAASKITLSVETDARSAGQGNIVTVMTEERDDKSSDECIAFTVKGF